ncbi:MAG TPA: septum formation initiator family protein [Acidimicrobiales bacterium]|nr:septum formation initiator family protein [Acidimicrobiales bacterium]
MASTRRSRRLAKDRAPTRRDAPRDRSGTRAERQTARRAEIRRRRDRALLLGAVVLSGLMLAAWFPASALYHQHQQLAATSASLASVRTEDAALRQEEDRLGSSSEVKRIAREQYQLVEPGQQAYEVLPSSGGAYDGDPGLEGPVKPSAASELPPGSAGQSGAKPASGEAQGSGHRSSTARSHAAASSSAAPTSLMGRIAQTLEFWR